MQSTAVEIMFGQKVPNCDHSVDKVYDGYYTLQLAVSGRVRVKIGKVDRVLTGPCVWSCYPGPRCTFHSANSSSSPSGGLGGVSGGGRGSGNGGGRGGGWLHRYVAFRGPGVAKWIGEGIFPIEPARLTGLLRRGDGLARLCSEFDELLAVAKRTDAIGAKLAVHLLEGLLLRLADARRHGLNRPAWLKAALEGLGKPGSAQSSVDQLSKSLGQPLSTFRRRFKAAVGVSPVQYGVAARVSEAKAMLMESDLPIKDIADQLGYRDVYFFTRQFARHAGMPPGEYRKKREGKGPI